MIICGDALTELKKLESESVDCCITSPPYFNQRDYNIDGQFGLEKTPEEYINKLIMVFDEVQRVLKKTGTCWVVIADTYNEFKSLSMVPERFSIAMIDHDWILRNKIVWFKPNCMPSSVKDRFTVDWEYVYFFVKNQRYFFETQYEPHNPKYDYRYDSPFGGIDNKSGQGAFNYTESRMIKPNPLGRIKRTVWRIPTKPLKEAHFATFPTTLVEPMLKAGCPSDGIVLDPFFGAGTVGLIALQQNKDFIGIELNPEYIKIAEQRLKQ